MKKTSPLNDMDNIKFPKQILVKHVIAKTNKNNFKNMKFEYIENTSTTFNLICMPHKKA